MMDQLRSIALRLNTEKFNAGLRRLAAQLADGSSGVFEGQLPYIGPVIQVLVCKAEAKLGDGWQAIVRAFMLPLHLTHVRADGTDVDNLNLAGDDYVFLRLDRAKINKALAKKESTPTKKLALKAAKGPLSADSIPPNVIYNGGMHCTNVQQPVCIDLERYLNLRHSARGGWNASKLEIPEAVVVLGHGPLALKDLR